LKDSTLRFPLVGKIEVLQLRCFLEYAPLLKVLAFFMELK